MTEAEALELIGIYTGNAHSLFTIYISVTFAYFATAFFVGSRLTSYQALAASGLYFISAISVAVALIANIQVWVLVAENTTTLMDGVQLFNGNIWIPSLSLVMSVGIIASLYFMWDVRRRETE